MKVLELEGATQTFGLPGAAAEVRRWQSGRSSPRTVSSSNSVTDPGRSAADVYRALAAAAAQDLVEAVPGVDLRAHADVVTRSKITSTTTGTLLD